MQTKTLRWLIAITVAAVGNLPLQREWRLNQLTRGGAHARSSPSWRNQSERLAYYKRKRAFAILWLERDKKSVRQPLELYLSDTAPDLRVSAVRALGWLEQPDGLKALRAVQKCIADGREKQMRLQTVQLAQGRIQARGLTGKKKLDAFCQSVGLTWNEVVRLSHKVNGPSISQGSASGADSPAVEIVQEIVDLLYSMGKKKDDIAPFAKQLALLPAQKVHLQGATLPVRAECEFILDYVTKLSVIDTPDERLGEDHLVGLGEPAVEALSKRLQDMMASPNKYKDPRGYGTRHIVVFRAASRTNRAQLLPLLRKFEKGLPGQPDKWVQGDAYRAIRRMEEKTVAPSFPA